jgi:peroxiredoxin
MKKQKRVLMSLVMRGLVCVVLCCSGLSSQASAQDNSLEELLQSMRITVPQQRLPAPSFTLSKLAGRTLHLSDYRGKVVLLNFWASFCTPCLEEMPALEALWQDYREQGFVVLAIAADRGSIDPVRHFVEAGNYSFPIPLDPDGSVRKQYEVMALPTTYLIGRDGRFAGRVLGAREWNSPQGRLLVQRLLQQTK